MKNTNTRRGFTLIELLVVVLIVGILAAVAVPQYQKAVIKSRVSTILPVLAALNKAEEAYFLANGTYTSSAHNLDIQLSGNCVDISTGHFWKCGSYFLISVGNEEGHTIANYCPGYNESYDSCKDNKLFQIYLYPKQPENYYCSFSTSVGKRICESLNPDQNS